MRMTFDIRKEVESVVEGLFLNKMNITNKLWIEYSNDYPNDYQTIYNNWLHHGVNVPIEGYYGQYDPEKRKVILFLPAISEPCSSTGLKFEHFFKIVLYFEVSQYILHAIFLERDSSHYGLYIKTGSFFRNFIGMMLTYKLVQYDPNLNILFCNIIGSLNNEYQFCQTFIKTRNKEFELPGIHLYHIMRLMKKVREYNLENITRDDVMEYYNNYVWRNIKKNVFTLNHFYEVMTQRQKKKHEHFGYKFGFYDE